MEIIKYKTRFSLISSGKSSVEKQIFLVVTIEGQEIFYYSGYRIHPDNFIKETVKLSNGTIYIQQAKKNTFNKSGDSAFTINARLKDLENASLLVFEQDFKGRDMEFSKADFKKLLQIKLGEYTDTANEKENSSVNLCTIHDKFIEFHKSKGTYKRYHTADHNKFLRYANHLKHEIDINTFNPEEYYRYISKGLKQNSLVTIMKRVRTFYNWMKSNKFININPFDDINFSEKFGTEIYSEPICMTRKELTLLYKHRAKTAHKELVKDMFCLQATLGCRVGDFVRLTYSNVQNETLTYYPTKTQEYADKVVVPLSKRAKEILSKYKGKGANNLIMPFINVNEYNETLKEVFKDADLNRIVIWYDRDAKKEMSAPLHDIASSHLARRTFVDILCQAGEPIHVVASMSGHSENSKAFDRYRRRPEQLQVKAVSRSMD